MPYRQLIIPELECYFPELLIPENLPQSHRKKFKTLAEMLGYFKRNVRKRSGHKGFCSHGSRILSKLESCGVIVKEGHKYNFTDPVTRKLFNRYYADEIIAELNS